MPALDEEKRRKARERLQRWTAANRERVREVKRAWKKRNPDKVAANNRRYAAAHPEKIAAKWKRHQAAFPDKCAARTAKYRDKNREKVNAALRAWFQTPEGKAARVNGERRRRVRKMGCDAIATAKQVSELLTNARGCFYCEAPFGAGNAPTVDHVVPLARGGAHSVDNLVAACGTCNARKGTMLPHEFMAKSSLSAMCVGKFT